MLKDTQKQEQTSMPPRPRKQRWLYQWMKPSFSISTQVFLGFVVVLLLFSGVNLWGIYQIQRIGAQLRLLRGSDLQMTTLASQLEALELNKRAAIRQFVSQPVEAWSPNQLPRLSYSSGIQRKVEQRIRRLARLLQRLSPSERLDVSRSYLQLRKVLRLLQDYQHHIRRIQSSLQKQLNAPTLPSQYRHRQQLRHEFKQTELSLRRQISLLSMQMDTRLTQAVLQVERQERRAVFWLLMLSIFAALTGLLVLLLSQRPLRRINRLVDMAQKIGEGDYQRRVDIPEGNEIGQLAQAFNHMGESLLQRDRVLAQQREALEAAYQDLQNSTDRLRRSERLATIGQLAAQITHEIRNPLNAIGLNLELLEEDLERLPDALESKAVLNATMSEVEHLTQITAEYLRFARLPAPQLEAADINVLLSDLMEFLSSELIAKGVHWELTLEEALPAVNIDQRQLRQALLNLIRNAMQAAASHHSREGSLTLRTFYDPDTNANEVELHIQDNGIGIPAEAQDKIFDPFFSTKEEGTGLGLPLTQQIIEGHGGHITCDSHQDKGTRFILCLPIAA